MFVCRPSISLPLLSYHSPNLRSIIFWQSSPPRRGLAGSRANLFPDRTTRIIFHRGFSSIFRKLLLCTPLHGSYYLSIYLYTVYTYMHLLQTRRGGIDPSSLFSIFRRAPFRSFRSRTGSSINHRISLTLVLFSRGSFADVDIAKSSLLGRDWFFFFLFSFSFFFYVSSPLVEYPCRVSRYAFFWNTRDGNLHNTAHVRNWLWTGEKLKDSPTQSRLKLWSFTLRPHCYRLKVLAQGKMRC